MFRAFAKANALALAAHTCIRASRPDAGRGVWAAKKADTHGELYIYEGIGASFWDDGVTAPAVAAQLVKLKGVTVLDVYINSEGGSVIDGLGIYNSLKRFDAEKIVHIDGIAASAASFIAMAGDKIVTAESAVWMIHGAQAVVGGSADEIVESGIKVIDPFNRSIAGIYAARTGRPVTDFFDRPVEGKAFLPATGLMAKETWFTAEQALAAKLTDEIEKNAAAGEPEARATASAPILRIADETQRHLAAAKTHRASVLADMEQSLLNDRLRASPKAQRPAASDVTRNSPPLRSA